ncbi:hypothetical protein CHLNCDRAFT_141721 [Chlorella variabilis]|uniref:Inositol polyphosphate multikinase n=1 Tax=Chlorella variabilis TaxID=554065 RepID=E1ZTG4_CHLVA|nr:hypothetical protein CHLNCDRAFT_141721 [Chlorella variabilis]EFN50926.1 hypothetical protein CHLNCDRAFT_141721 [Chlorella variabilis]|eukprot:XP_005843028.1 hypothetical protein CHLNCDRAFT_141721 [Chlorella variabilis]
MSQVAGHLFEDGKAGSLIDDRGHFYKPLQRGPRGDRERAFYDVVDAMLHSEQAAAAELQRSAPVPVPNGGSVNSAVDTAALAEAALPWQQRRLRQLFPSFRGSLKERGPMAVMQRDELGLLSGRTMAKLGLLGSSPHRSSPPQQQQTAVAVAAAVSPEQQEVQQEQQGEAWQGEEVEEQELSAQYGQSPDSDCSEQTGQHLMENFHEGMAGGSYASPDAGVQLQGSPGAADVRGSEGGSTLAAALPQLSRPPPQQQQTSPGPSVEASCEHRHMIESPREAYTLPEHAQAAALLGQPAFDRGLSVGSNSRPPRSPFMSGLLHHSHPPGPQEQQRAAAAAVPSAGSVDGDSGALAAALARMSGLGTVPTVSSEVHWLHGEGQATSSSSNGGSSANFATLPFSVRNAPLLHVIPKYYGVTQHEDARTLLELEDLARAYRHPCIIDIKVGFRTWYPQADDKYIQRCKEKDESTTQAALGFKICGMQVFRHGAGGYWRASKRWCKTLPVELVDKALLSFAHNEHGLRPADVYGGAAGAIVQLEALEAWFSVQRDFHFYSSSVLLLYEGGARNADQAGVRVRMVDFAHTFQAEDGGRDTNFLAGLRALLARLRAVVRATVQQDLPTV